MSMNEQIQEAIRKNLSAEVGVELQKLLATIPEMQKKIDKLVGDANDDKAKIASAKSENEALKKQLEVHAAITERESKVLEREKSMTLMEYKVIAAQEGKKDIFELVSTIFKNPTVKQTVVGEMPVMTTYGPTGQIGYPITTQFKNTTENTTI